MTKGRTTTYEEKTEIVSFCIANNDDYQMTSKQFEVSYQQVYTWVKKTEIRAMKHCLTDEANVKTLKN